jgi:hypothetical protein
MLLELPPDKLAEEREYVTRFLGSNERWQHEIKTLFGARDRDRGFVHLDVASCLIPSGWLGGRLR